MPVSPQLAEVFGPENLKPSGHLWNDPLRVRALTPNGKKSVLLGCFDEGVILQYIEHVR